MVEPVPGGGRLADWNNPAWEFESYLRPITSAIQTRISGEREQDDRPPGREAVHLIGVVL